MGGKPSNENFLDGAYVDYMFFIQRGMFVVPLARAPVAQWELGAMGPREMVKMLEGE
jgi:hypothetical protein